MVLGGPKGAGEEPRDPRVAGADVQVMEVLWGWSGQVSRFWTDPGGGTTGPTAGSDGEEIKEDVSLRIACRDPGPNTSSS